MSVPFLMHLQNHLFAGREKRGPDRSGNNHDCEVHDDRREAGSRCLAGGSPVLRRSDRLLFNEGSLPVGSSRLIR